MQVTLSKILGTVRERIVYTFLRLSRCGVDHRLSTNLAKRVVITNQISLTIGLISFVKAGFFWVFLDSRWMPFNAFLVGLAYFSLCWLNRVGYHYSARIGLMTLSNFAILSYASYLGEGAGAQLWFYALACFPLMLFQPKNKLAISYGILLPVASLTLLKHLDYRLFGDYFPHGALPPYIENWVYTGMSLTAFLTLGSALFYFYLANQRAEKRLEESVTRLRKEVAERRWSEMALHEEKEKLRSIFDSCEDVIFFVDRNLRYLEVNKQIGRYGYDPRDLEGKTLWDMVDKERVTYFEKLYQQVFKSGRTIHVQNQREHRGQIFSYRLALTPVKANGEVIGLVGVSRDITDQKNTEKELRRARDLAERANAAKSVFLANMSHEIRTPMGAVLGFAEMLLSPRITDEERRNCIEVIIRNGRHLVTLIDDILDLAKIEAGELKIEKVPVVLADEIMSVVRLLRPQAEAKGVHLNVKVEGLIPEVVSTDPTRLRQVLMNILGNAVKFTQFGDVTLFVRLGDEMGQGHRPFLEMEVADTGCGIPQEHQKSLFKPFSQADPSATRRYGGTGLGLFLGRHLAESLGGSLSLKESSLGKGSRFLICIDPGDIHHGPLVSSLRKSAAVKLSAGTMPTKRMALENVRVLIVEDSPDIQILLTQILKSAGAQVSLVGNGEKAVKEILTNQFDVVLMDIQLPGMDGYTVTSTVRKTQYKGPIIALTAHAMKGEKERCLKVGCNDYLSKPVASHDLINAVLTWSRQAHQAR